MCALGAEVIWTRLLSLMFGATVYTFSIILAVFLMGLGIGSGAGSALARVSPRPRVALGWCQLALTAAIAWTALMIARSLPYWPVNPTLAKSPWFNFQLDLARCIWTILPAACLWGASFPLALAAVASRRQDPGRLVGGVYAANTVGAIAGAIGFSMVFIPWIGTQQSQRVLIGLTAMAALIALVPVGTRRRRAPTVAACLLLAVLLAWSVAKIPFEAIGFGRRMLTTVYNSKPLFVGEGMNASIAVSEMSDGMRMFHVSGKVEASSDPTDMRLERMLGHIPAILHPGPKSVLVVGCGAGVTAGSFVLYPGVERIVICEIEPLIPKVVARYFGEENYDVLDDPRVHVVYDDARHYILTTGEKFDIITSDPIHPWIKGSAALYSREYFELCKAHLNPGGLITQWVPLYESTPVTVKSELATFFRVFPEGTIWGNDVDGLGYDVVLLGRDGPLTVDLEALEARLARADYQAVDRSLGGVGFPSALALFSCYAGRGPELQAWLKGAPINRDRNMRLQYLAGLGLNTAQSIPIFEEMLAYRKFPADMFLGPEAKVAALKEFLGPRKK
jgi:spermidine synthase